MPQGLPRRIKLAFIAQALVVSVVMCLFLLAAGLAVRQSILNWVVHREATRFWTHSSLQSSEALPRSRAFEGYFVPAGSSPDVLPPMMRDMPPGLNRIAVSRFVYVDERPRGRFVLSMDTTVVDVAILATVFCTLLFALGISYLMAWMTYRTTKRMVVPVSWLAGVVAQWDPRAPDTSVIRANRLPPDSGSEVHQLTGALTGLAGAALSGCVVRPLGWGWDRDGHRHGGRHYVDSDRDRGRSPGYDNSRDETRRRGW